MPSSDRTSLNGSSRHTGNFVDSIIHAKDKAKEKTKQLLPHKRHRTSSAGTDDIFSDPAFDPIPALNEPSPKQQEKSATNTGKDALSKAAYVVTHPVDVIRNKATQVAAGKLGKRHPLLSPDHDEELLDAHDAVSKALLGENASDTSDIDEAVADLDKAQTRVKKIRQKRESLQTAWILSRHISRVRVSRPVAYIPRSQFEKAGRFEWERYLGHLALYHTRGFTSGYIDAFDSPPFDLEDLARVVERIAITSAPWQSFFMKVRHVYMWQDPQETGKWLALFCVLWYFQYIITYLYFYIIYATFRNRFRGTSVHTVRESVGRAVDREARVQAWGELIQRHGQHDWIEPLLDEIGPLIQLQLTDLADMLEMLLNFHRWERPHLSLASLFFFVCCLLVTLCADMAFCVKLVWFIVGGGFFFMYPIATNFPKYRLLVSPWRWIFWNVPSHAELAVLTVQKKAAEHDASLDEFDYINDDRANMSWRVAAQEYSFRVYEKTGGKSQLTIHRLSLTLSTKSGPNRTWPFSTLTEIRKLDDTDIDSTSAVKNLRRLRSRSASGLYFLFVDGTDVTVILHPVDQDRVFNLIVAWSGLKWQCLQMERHGGLGGGRGNLDKAIKKALT